MRCRVSTCLAFLSVSVHAVVLKTRGDDHIIQDKRAESNTSKPVVIAKTEVDGNALPQAKPEPKKLDGSEVKNNLRNRAADVNDVTLAGTFTNSTGSVSQGIIPTTSCLPDTGGTCMVQRCAPWRGATCGHGFKCTCPTGSCAGADGKCYQQPYETLGSKFRLRNAMYPDHYIYVSTWWSGLYVTTSLSPQSDFVVKKLPDESVVISPTLFPHYIAHTAVSEHCNEDDHCTRTYDPEVRYIDGWWHAMSAPSAAMNLETLNHDGKDYIMIAGRDYPNKYFTTSKFSSHVSTTTGDGGLYSYWVFEPPLPFQPPAFKGRRCSFMCGW